MCYDPHLPQCDHKPLSVISIDDDPRFFPSFAFFSNEVIAHSRCQWIFPCMQDERSVFPGVSWYFTSCALSAHYKYPVGEENKHCGSEDHLTSYFENMS